MASGARVGQVTSAVWSPDLATNVAIAMIDRSHWQPGTRAQVEAPDGLRDAEITALPFTEG